MDTVKVNRALLQSLYDGIDDYWSDHQGAEAYAELRALLSEQPQAGAGQDVPVAECTNEDSWNCKYCRKTEACAALKDERNFGSPQKADRQEPVHITHRPLIRNAISLLSMRRPMAPDVERVVTDLSAMLDGLPTPAGAPSTAWLQVAEMAEAPSARHDQGDEVRRLREALAPFAALAQLFDDGARGGTMPETGAIAAWPRLGANRELIENELTVEHLRAARAALTHSPQGAKE